MVLFFAFLQIELMQDEINDNSVIDLSGLKNRLKKEEI